ncbi:MAG: type I-U CRISPR-associated protein Csx17 [Planctomycetota bacterium]|nr:type I-U CRISPR-associated protein Csx17 [Planctomycetota bacterium]
MSKPLPLPGCTPEPLLSYLKTLGVFRLVAEQADPDARLSWRNGFACLRTKLTRDELTAFFLDDYRPTPILAPWNGGGGFFGAGSEPLDRIADSDAERLHLYRETISRIRKFVPESKPKDDEKRALLIRCRAELADEVVPWLDVCFALSEDRPRFFPLLGTGGTDGRLEFTNNFMQRLADVMSFASDAEPIGTTNDLLAAALFADTFVSLGNNAIGQFNPGGIGGANGTQGSFEADSRVNPWDFVLMIEGTLLFAGSVARRMSANSTSRAVFPFSVESVAVGYGSATAIEETTDGSRAELWLPLWENGCTLAEVRHLFAEGRAQLGRRQAKNAVEFALAVNLLGVNRGVTSFARYGFLKRNGLAFLATPLGRVNVELRPQARLLNDPPVAEWLDRWRRACSDKDKTPARYQLALRQIDRAMFAFANRSEHGNDAAHLLDVITSFGKAERTLANGLRFAEDKYLRPLQRLSSQWLEQADDGSGEFRLAAAVAGIRGTRDSVGTFRTFLEKVEVTNFVNWSPGSVSAVWSNRPLGANLAAVFRRRQMEAFRKGLNCVPLSSPRPACLSDVLAFLKGETDDDKLTALLWALPALDWSAVEFKLPVKTEPDELDLPFEFGVPRLLVERGVLEADGRGWSYRKAADGEVPNAKPDPQAFHLLASGQRNAVGLAVNRAAYRLKSGGRLVNGYRNGQQTGRSLAVFSSVDPERLLAAMLFPLANHDMELIAKSVLYPPESKE